MEHNSVADEAFEEISAAVLQAHGFSSWDEFWAHQMPMIERHERYTNSWRFRYIGRNIIRLRFFIYDFLEFLGWQFVCSDCLVRHSSNTDCL